MSVAKLKKQYKKTPLRILIGATACVFLLAVFINALSPSHPPKVSADSAPATPPTGSQLCNSGTDSSLLTSPYTSAPANGFNGTTTTVTVSGVPTANVTSNTTYYFTAGTHTGTFNSDDNDVSNVTVVGAPGAILSGGNTSDNAMGGNLNSVTLEYMTIEDYKPPSQAVAINLGNNGVGQGTNWTVKYNTIEDIGNQGGLNSGFGAALGLGSNMAVTHNCFTNDGESAIQTSNSGVITNATVTYNEVAKSGSAAFPDDPNGEDAGIKTFTTVDTTLEDNYIHDNYAAGIWIDTDNAGWTIEDNYIARNYGQGLDTEISYNFIVEYNTFVDNGWGAGSRCAGCSDEYGSAIYVNNSGGDSRVTGSPTYLIEYNNFIDNWDGVEEFMDVDRYGGSGDDAQDGIGTLVNPSESNLNTCKTPGISSAPLFTDCAWPIRNVDVEHNNFVFNPSHIENSVDPNGNSVSIVGAPNVADCANSDEDCGYQARWDVYGTSSSAPAYDTYGLTPYVFDVNTGTNCSSGPCSYNNVYADNCYAGPWLFDEPNQAQTVTWAQWTTGFRDPNSGDAIPGEDLGSSDTASTGACNTSPSGSPPTVSITSLADDDTVHGGSVSVAVNVTPNDGGSITGASISVDGGAALQTLTGTPPYTFPLSTLSYPDGSHTLTVSATDDQGNTGTSSITVYVTNGDFLVHNNVTGADLGVLAQHWGTQSGATYSQGDISGDGRVNGVDLGYLAQNWGKSWTP